MLPSGSRIRNNMIPAESVVMLVPMNSPEGYAALFACHARENGNPVLLLSLVARAKVAGFPPGQRGNDRRADSAQVQHLAARRRALRISAGSSECTRVRVESHSWCSVEAKPINACLATP